MSKNILVMSHVYKSFPYVEVLNNVNLCITEGKSVALTGESGSGKSTLLHIASLLDTPTSGEVIINGYSSNKTTDKEKTKIRREYIGFVYQFHNLLSEFNSTENVMMPLLINQISKKEAKERARTLLELVGLSHRLEQYPNKLSGGEQQRVAIARAMITEPKIIIADEPTGNLDNKTSNEVFDTLLEMLSTKKTALLMATHNIYLANKLERQIILSNGELIEE